MDDGSGHQIDLITWKTPPPNREPQKITPVDLAGVKLYSVVKAKGNVNEFWGRKQVLLKRITVLKDTNEEMAALAETTEFKRNVLSKPWVVSEETMADEKRKLGMDEEDEAKERRKLKKQRKSARRVEDTEMGGQWKENMLVDILVKKPGREEEWRMARVKTRESTLSPKRKKPGSSVEPSSIPDTSYRGHRRPPGLKLLPLRLPMISPLPPEVLEREESPSITASNYRGHRRIIAAPVSNSLPPPPIPITPEPEPEPLFPLLDSTYRGHRRAYRTKKPQLEPEPETNALGIPTANINPESTSYRGRRRTSKLPIDAPTPAPAPALVSTYPPSESVLDHTQQQSPAESSSSYRGHRRNPKPPSDTATPNIPVSPPRISYRERWRIIKAQKAAAALALAISELSGTESIPDHGGCRAPKPLPADASEIIPSISTFVPTSPPEVSARGSEVQQYTRYLADHVPPSGNPSQIPDPSISSYRGRRRI